MLAEELAQLFHETYERLAPEYNYQTRKASAVPWSAVPENNKKLMIAVAGEVLKAMEEDECAWDADMKDMQRIKNEVHEWEDRNS